VTTNPRLAPRRVVRGSACGAARLRTPTIQTCDATSCKSPGHGSRPGPRRFISRHRGRRQRPWRRVWLAGLPVHDLELRPRVVVRTRSRQPGRPAAWPATRSSKPTRSPHRLRPTNPRRRRGREQRRLQRGGVQSLPATAMRRPPPLPGQVVAHRAVRDAERPREASIATARSSAPPLPSQ